MEVNFMTLPRSGMLAIYQFKTGTCGWWKTQRKEPQILLK